MRFMDLFFGKNRIKTMEADEAFRWIEGRSSETFTLLDVRNPGEFAKGYIPGAVLVPLPQLVQRLGEINPEKPVLAY